MFVTQEGLCLVPVLQILLPLMVLMVELALVGFVMEGFSEKVPLPWFGQYLF